MEVFCIASRHFSAQNDGDPSAPRAFLDDLAAGTFVVDCLDRKELGLARDLARRYRDLELGLADASLAVLADRHRTDRIASFDERAFRAMTPLRGDAFTILPADRAES